MHGGAAYAEARIARGLAGTKENPDPARPCPQDKADRKFKADSPINSGSPTSPMCKPQWERPAPLLSSTPSPETLSDDASRPQ